MPDETFDNKAEDKNPANDSGGTLDNDVVDVEDEPQDDQAEKDLDALAAAYDQNPVVQTYDKSAGDPTEAAPDYGHVIRQGGVPDLRSDQDTEYPDQEDFPTGSQLALDRETAPYEPVAPGEGPDEGQVVGEVPDGPSVVQGSKDYVPNPPTEAMSVQEQIERGIGTPQPNVETPGYDEPDESGRHLTSVEQSIVDGENNPQNLFVNGEDPKDPDSNEDRPEVTSGLVEVETVADENANEGPRDAHPDKYAPN